MTHANSLDRSSSSGHSTRCTAPLRAWLIPRSNEADVLLPLAEYEAVREIVEDERRAEGDPGGGPTQRRGVTKPELAETLWRLGQPGRLNSCQVAHKKSTTT